MTVDRAAPTHAREHTGCKADVAAPPFLMVPVGLWRRNPQYDSARNRRRWRSVHELETDAIIVLEE